MSGAIREFLGRVHQAARVPITCLVTRSAALPSIFIHVDGQVTFPKLQKDTLRKLYNSKYSKYGPFSFHGKLRHSSPVPPSPRKTRGRIRKHTRTHRKPSTLALDAVQQRRAPHPSPLTPIIPYNPTPRPPPCFPPNYTQRLDGEASLLYVSSKRAPP